MSKERKSSKKPRSSPEKSPKLPPAPVASDSEDAPEAVSLEASRTSALTQMRSVREAGAKVAAAGKERRRAHDALLKAQAERRQKIEAALAELRPERPEGSERTRPAAAPQSKRITFESETATAEEEETVVGPGARVIKLSGNRRKVVKLSLGKACELSKRRDELLARNGANRRVHISHLMASARLGRPAAVFRLPSGTFSYAEKIGPREKLL